MSVYFTVLLGVVAGLPALSIDLSAPTLAVLPFELATTTFIAGLSLSLFVLGFAVGQFVGGQWSDKIGRRPVLLSALFVYTFGGLCCVLATAGGALATARFVQGCGAGACAVQAYAIIQDLFKGEDARRKQAYVSVVLTVLPMLAPALGAMLTLWFGWRSVHVTMMVGGLVLVAVVSRAVRESRPRHLRPRRGLGFADSVSLLRDRAFRIVAVVNALSYASIFAYIAGAPVIIITQFGFGNLAYAVLFACTAAALSCGAFASARLSTRFDTSRLAWPALMMQAAANLLLIATSLVQARGGEWVFLPLLVASCFARGVIAPNLVHAAISSHREQAGLASALVGLTQLVFAAVSSAMLARLLGQYGAVALAGAMAALTTAAVALWLNFNVGGMLAERS